jgi:serine/threonine-protein kinase RsbW
MNRRRILIVESSSDLRDELRQTLGELGHEVVACSNRDEAIGRDDLEDFDLIISDLTEEVEDALHVAGNHQRHRLCIPVSVSADESCQDYIVKAFKVGASNFARPYDQTELRTIVEKTLSHKLLYVEDPETLPLVREYVEFELPSDISLMNGVLHFLIERVAQLGVIKPDRSNLFIALDEAFVNAVKHGNKNDPTKLVRVTADLSSKEARFTVEDEGEGFNPHDIPDPLDPANLFKTSGRGVLLIYNIMDEVQYNERGNRLTMVKRPENPLEAKLPPALTPDDVPAPKS